jgi:oligopeptide transport system substrate-binding protein
VPAFGTYFWNFNCAPTLADGRPNPFADARVRRAFALVVDKRAIAEQVRRLGEPTARR